MSYTYDSFVEALSVESKIPTDDASLVAILPTVIMAAEGRIYRDLSLLATYVSDATGSVGADTRQFTLPRHFVVLHSVNRVSGNNRLPMVKVSREALDTLYPATVSTDVSDVPLKWAPLTDQIILVGPVAGATTQLVCIGEAFPAPLTADNDETWLSLWLPDLLLASAMIALTGYMRQYGAQADDPQMATSWRGIYESLLPAAKSEETRRKYAAAVS